MVLGFGKKKAAQIAKEAERDRKIAESQRLLLAAAIATADVAQDVTQNLKKKLDEATKQFETTARILKDGLIICNGLGIVTSFNPAAEKLFGIKSKDILRKSVLTLFSSKVGEIPDAAALWAILQNEDHSDVVGKTDEGVMFPVQVSLSFLDRSDGSNSYMLLVRDLTEDELWRATENRYQTLFETSFDGNVIIMTDGGCLVAANPALSRLFGYPVATLMGKPITDLIADKDHERLLACRPRPGRASNDFPQHFTVEGRHSSGKTLDLVFTLTEIRWDGKKAILATIRDMTEMRRLEGLVSMKRDNGVDMLCCFDTNYRITFVNQTFAKYADSKRKDLIGIDIRDLMSKEQQVIFEKNIESISIDNPVVRTQVDGEDNIEDWIDHAIFDDQGRITEYQRMGRDITIAMRTIQSTKVSEE
jgi:PAS domain S-box-containing protein